MKMALKKSRGERIRTSDPLNPIQVRYQAALLPEKLPRPNPSAMTEQGKSAMEHVQLDLVTHLVNPVT